MEKFKDLQHFQTVTKCFKTKYAPTVNNSFFTTENLERLIYEARLYYEAYDRTLMIFQDEGEYWEMSFIASPDSKATPLILDKDCAVTIYTRNNDMSDKYCILQKLTQDFGFQFAHRYRYYEWKNSKNKNVKDELSDLSIGLEKNGFKIISFIDKYKNEVCDLWDKCFDSVTIGLDDRKKEINNSFLAVNFDDELCGAYTPKQNGNTYSMWHLSVAPKYRGKKLSRLLALTLIDNAVQLGYQKVFNWIADDNIPSLNLHKNLGMTATQNIADKYLLLSIR